MEVSQADNFSWTFGFKEEKGQEGEQNFYSLVYKDLLVKPDFKGRENIIPFQGISLIITASLQGKRLKEYFSNEETECEMV